eukprot:TRINITY_DN69251_c0_g1_i1.p1 TRINITY_DN69251_c0_g1~~TRINITY_DN69251_c0_g1_i1.p1  ORF type:complete len:173 (+),score=27.26 TRINITY_DN69251_c0_g1_i1:58-576(+)
MALPSALPWSRDRPQESIILCDLVPLTKSPPPTRQDITKHGKIRCRPVRPVGKSSAERNRSRPCTACSLVAQINAREAAAAAAGAKHKEVDDEVAKIASSVAGLEADMAKVARQCQALAKTSKALMQRNPAADLAKRALACPVGGYRRQTGVVEKKKPWSIYDKIRYDDFIY